MDEDLTRGGRHRRTGRHLLGLPTPFDVLDPPGVIDAMRDHLERSLTALQPSGG
jgi:hypothetical protein